MLNNYNATRTLMVAVALGVSFFVVLALMRLIYAISFTEPLQMQTSGAEFESLFAVWKYIHGLAVYNDRYQPPYNAAMYNWLFYESYGFFTKSVMMALDLTDAWLPTTARFLTLFAAATVAATAYKAFVKANAAQGLSRVVPAGFALLVATGPLLGFWVFTVRPDIWALAFEILAATWFILNYPTRRWTALLGAAFFAYLAWSFKQSSVFFLLSVGFFLLIRMAWRQLAFMIFIMAAAFALTFIFGEPQYVRNILFSGYPLEFTFDRGTTNITSFTIKMVPAVVLMITALIYRFFRTGAWAEIWRDDTKLFCLVAALVSGSLAVAISFQVGGAENYFFAFSFYLSLCGLALLPGIADWPRPATFLIATGWLVLAAAVAMVFTGRVGITDLRPHHVSNTSIKNCIEPLQRPLYVEHPYVSLPWMSDDTTYFVLSYVYEKERRAGHTFVNGGIGGYIERGDLETLVLLGNSAPSSYDGAPLDKYEERPSACPGYVVMSRRNKK